MHDALGTPPTVPPPRVLVAGISGGPVCGVREHARILSTALREEGIAAEVEWQEGPVGAATVRALARSIERRSQQAPGAVILQYSVFAYSWRGIPVAVPLVAWRLWRLATPVILFAHEYAYPWGRRGWRGLIHAVTQRAALVPLVAASSAVVVATSERESWFRSRSWLPARPVRVAPVFSNIARHPSADYVGEVKCRVGVFSFGAEGLAAEVVAEGVAAARRHEPDAHLVLIGSPGADSAAGRRWQRAAEVAGCPVSFTGLGTEVEVSRALAACQVVVFPDPAGPTSRKTSLAAALSHTRPVVALDGPETWRDLVGARAVELVEPTAAALGRSLTRLFSDAAARTTLAKGGAAFSGAALSAESAARTVIALLRTFVAVPGRAPGSSGAPA